MKHYHTDDRFFSCECEGWHVHPKHHNHCQDCEKFHFEVTDALRTEIKPETIKWRYGDWFVDQRGRRMLVLYFFEETGILNAIDYRKVFDIPVDELDIESYEEEMHVSEIFAILLPGEWVWFESFRTDPKQEANFYGEFQF